MPSRRINDSANRRAFNRVPETCPDVDPHYKELTNALDEIEKDLLPHIEILRARFAHIREALNQFRDNEQSSRARLRLGMIDAYQEAIEFEEELEIAKEERDNFKKKLDDVRSENKELEHRLDLLEDELANIKT